MDGSTTEGVIMDIECRTCGVVNHIDRDAPPSDYRCWNCISWLYDDEEASTKEDDDAATFEDAVRLWFRRARVS